jgi:pimeloyl-ACP methyl ester carboxylesterase
MPATTHFDQRHSCDLGLPLHREPSPKRALFTVINPCERLHDGRSFRGMNSPATASPEANNPLNSITLGSSGPTLVLLHGWGRSLEALRPLGEILANRCRVVLIDLPGFGLSPLPHEASNDGGGWDTAQYAARVKRFLDQNSITSCILIGHSFGGRLSVRLASQHPDLARAVVLIGSHGLKRTRSTRDRVRLWCIKTSGTIAKKIDGLIGTRIFAHYFAPKFGSADYKASGDLRKTLVKTVNEDLSTQAKNIKAPTLLLWGALDQQTPLDLAHSYKSLINDSELHIFPGKGHEPFSDVGSHLTARYIEQFLTKRGILS